MQRRRSLQLWSLIFLAVLLAACTPASSSLPATPTETVEAPPGDSASPTEVVESGLPEGEAPLPLAMVRERNTLWLGDTSGLESFKMVTRCGEDCAFSRPRWSPDGSKLLYLINTFGDDATHRIVMEDLKDGPRVLTDQAAYRFAPAWSPDGQEVVFVTDTGRSEVGAARPESILQVWTLEVEGDGQPVPRGTIHYATGCGGGGTSISRHLYEEEGPDAPHLEWSRQGILLYTRHCGGTGIGRFDLQRGEELEPYLPLDAFRSLVLHPDGSRWAAVVEHGIAIGDPTKEEYEVIETVGQPDTLAFGQAGHRIYYTTRKEIQPEIGESTIRRYDEQSGEDVEIWRGMDYAYLHIVERPMGTLFFVRIQNDTRGAAQAAQNGASREDIAPIAPRRQIMRLPAEGSAPTLFLDQSGMPTIPASQPQGR